VDILSAIILGIVQALTEFFPVSSSAHIRLVKYFFHMNANVGMDLICHLGTIGAVIVFLRKEITLLLRNPVKLWPIFCAMLPLAPAYILLKPLREHVSQLSFLGMCWISTGIILLAGQFLSLYPMRNEKRYLRDVVIIGSMQATALIPGISRSASTISSARVLGWTMPEAVRFSFLLSLPTVCAGNLWELRNMNSFAVLWNISQITPYIIAGLVSFLLGYFIIEKAIRWLERGNLIPCALYCIALGIITTLYFNL